MHKDEQRSLVNGQRLVVIRLATASPSNSGHGEWSALGNRDINHTTGGARVREEAIESIRVAAATASVNRYRSGVALIYIRAGPRSISGTIFKAPPTAVPMLAPTAIHRPSFDPFHALTCQFTTLNGRAALN